MFFHRIQVSREQKVEVRAGVWSLFTSRCLLSVTEQQLKHGGATLNTSTLFFLFFFSPFYSY